MIEEKLVELYYREGNILQEYRLQSEEIPIEKVALLSDIDSALEDINIQNDLEQMQNKAGRRMITLEYEGRRHTPYDLLGRLSEHLATHRNILTEKDKELYEEVIMNSIGRIISQRIRAAEQWVLDMNKLMRERDTSSGLRFRREWKARVAEQDEEIDTVD